MTGKQYRILRKRLRLSQQELADLVGVAANTVARRERGELPIDREAELAIRRVAWQAIRSAAPAEGPLGTAGDADSVAEDTKP